MSEPTTEAGKRLLTTSLTDATAMFGATLTEAVAAIEAEAAGKPTDGIDAAWAAAEAALPEGWTMATGSIIHDPSRTVVYWAGAGTDLDDPDTLCGGKDSPATALLALAARLSESGGSR